MILDQTTHNADSVDETENPDDQNSKLRIVKSREIAKMDPEVARAAAKTVKMAEIGRRDQIDEVRGDLRDEFGLVLLNGRIDDNQWRTLAHALQKRAREDIGDIKGLRECYDALPFTGDVLDLRQLEEIGEGGTHKIYSSPKSSVVIKIKHDDISATDFRSEQKAYRGLNSNFAERSMLQMGVVVPVITPEGQRKKVRVLVQKKEDELFKRKDIVDFSTAYPEGYVRESATYAAMNRGTLTRDPVNLLAYRGADVKLGKIFDLIQNDSGFKDAVIDFLEKLKSFNDETGHFIDISGEKNVVFYKENGEWTYKLGSVIKNDTKAGLKASLRMLRRRPEDFAKPENRKKLNVLSGALNCCRFANALGVACGMGKVFDFNLNSRYLQNLEKIRQEKIRAAGSSDSDREFDDNANLAAA